MTSKSRAFQKAWLVFRKFLEEFIPRKTLQLEMESYFQKRGFYSEVLFDSPGGFILYAYK